MNTLLTHLCPFTERSLSELNNYPHMDLQSHPLLISPMNLDLPEDEDEAEDDPTILHEHPSPTSPMKMKSFGKRIQRKKKKCPDDSLDPNAQLWPYHSKNNRS